MPPSKWIFLLALAILALALCGAASAPARGGGGGGHAAAAGGGRAKGYAAAAAAGGGGGRAKGYAAAAAGGGGGGRAKGHVAAGGGGGRAKGHAGGILSEPHPRPDVVVGIPGDVTSINEALARLEVLKRKTADAYFVIYIKAGVYEEYLNITTDKVAFIGQGMEATIITGNRSKGKGFNTELSATMTILGKGFIARDLGIRNTAGDPSDEQAVALFSYSPNSVFYKCDVRGYQDTLLAKDHAQFYRNCQIWGTIDFIFGDARAIFQDCSIYIRAPPQGKTAVITAHGREFHNRSSGFVFQNCTVDVSPLPGEGLTGATYLGRPWQNHARVVFMFSSISRIVHADGWIPWNDTSVAGGKAPLPGHDKHFYFGSYRNHVLGSKELVHWHNFTEINITEARKFTPKRFLQADPWLPATGVPCYLGLGSS